MSGKRWRCAVSSVLAFITLSAAGAGVAVAQDKYPTRAIEMIVPFAPGGSTDLYGRAMGAYASKKWGVPVYIVNKPGARGIPQTQEVYRAAPDGYTLMVENPTTNTMLAAAMQKDLPFNIFDRTFLGMNSGTPFTVIVHPNSPYKTLGELLDAAKKTPEKISYTSQGSTGMPDYFIRLLFKKVGADVSKAPAILVTGAAPTITMTAGGNVVMGLSSASGALAAVKGGLVRALLISSKERDPDFPGVPSSGELGFPVAVSWNGISGPPNLPPYVVAAWAKVMQESVKDPEFIASLRKVGAAPLYQDAQGFRDFVKNEIDEASKLFGATK